MKASQKSFYKSLLALFLCICWLSPFTSTWFSLQYQKKQLKKNIKKKIIAGIPKNQLVLLKFTQSQQKQLRWEHSQEFEYKNQMYDIIYSEKTQDTTYYWCWWDYEETLLNRQLEQNLAQTWEKNPKNQENKLKLILFFKSLFYEKIQEINFFTLFSVPTHQYFWANHYAFFQILMPTPPPKNLK